MNMATNMAVITSVPSPESCSPPISDVKSSELVEAVVALNMAASQTTPKRPLTASTQIEGGDLDSGYASKSTTPETSTFESGGPFVVANKPFLSITKRKKKMLMYFEKEIPKSTQNRFEDLRELYAASLNSLASGISKRRGILMTLKVLGESEETAEPWVFIQCDKAIAKKVRRFFKQPSVISDFKPVEPNAYTPKLDIYVHELPPLLLGEESSHALLQTYPSPGSHESVELYLELKKNLDTPSLCGSKVVALINGHRRSATIGGLISIKTAQGHVHSFGITAGHFLNQDHETEELNEYLYAKYKEERGETDGDRDDEVFCDEEEFELDLSSLDIPSSAVALEDTAAGSSVQETVRLPIGHVYRTSQNGFQDRPNLDWAVFTIMDSTLILPNIVRMAEVTQTSTEEVEGTRMVVIATDSIEEVFGILTSSWSYLALAPGNGLVRTKAVKILPENKVLTPGDCGAWVVDVVSNQLYGHVVASDIFGIAYILPICDIFRDIQLQLSSPAVKLPVATLKTFSMPEIVHKVAIRSKELDWDDEFPSPRKIASRRLPTVDTSDARGSSKSNVLSEQNDPFKQNATESARFNYLRDPGLLDRSSAAETTTKFEAGRKLSEIIEDVVSSGTKSKIPKSLVDTISQHFVEDYDKSYPQKQQPTQPGVVMDSGYSTMANTPSVSAKTTPPTSKFPSPGRGQPMFKTSIPLNRPVGRQLEEN